MTVLAACSYGRRGPIWTWDAHVSMVSGSPKLTSHGWAWTRRGAWHAIDAWVAAHGAEPFAFATRNGRSDV